jgi:hypothetical protein
VAASRVLWRWSLLPVVAVAVAVPSLGNAAQPTHLLSGAKAGGKSMSATAPCSRAADVTVRVAHRDGAPEPDRMQVSVRDARPGSRWKLTVAQYQSDMGIVTLYPTQKANDRGRWSKRTVQPRAASPSKSRRNPGAGKCARCRCPAA